VSVQRLYGFLHLIRYRSRAWVKSGRDRWKSRFKLHIGGNLFQGLSMSQAQMYACALLSLWCCKWGYMSTNVARKPCGRSTLRITYRFPQRDSPHGCRRRWTGLRWKVAETRDEETWVHTSLSLYRATDGQSVATLTSGTSAEIRYSLFTECRKWAKMSFWDDSIRSCRFICGELELKCGGGKRNWGRTPVWIVDSLWTYILFVLE